MAEMPELGVELISTGTLSGCRCAIAAKILSLDVIGLRFYGSLPSAWKVVIRSR